MTNILLARRPEHVLDDPSTVITYPIFQFLKRHVKIRTGPQDFDDIHLRSTASSEYKRIAAIDEHLDSLILDAIEVIGVPVIDCLPYCHSILPDSFVVFANEHPS